MFRDTSPHNTGHIDLNTQAYHQIDIPKGKVKIHPKTAVPEEETLEYFRKQRLQKAKSDTWLRRNLNRLSSGVSSQVTSNTDFSYIVELKHDGWNTETTESECSAQGDLLCLEILFTGGISKPP